MSDKEKVLKDNGWYQWYNKNYWVNDSHAPEGSDPTYYGLSTEEAYKVVTDGDYAKKDKQAMDLHKSAMLCLQNMGEV